MEVIKFIIRVFLVVLAIGMIIVIGNVLGLLGLLVGFLVISQIVILIQQTGMKKMIKQLQEKSKE